MLKNVSVLTSGTGGAGKSTLTAGLACALALRGQKTLVLDCNPLCGGTAFFLGAPAASPYHLGDAAQRRCSLREAIFPCETAVGLHLALPPAAMDELPDGENLSQWLGELEGQFDQILIDAPFWSPCFPAAASLAGATLVIAAADPYSVSCCDRLRTAPPGRAIRNPRLVLNRFHRRRFLRQGAFRDLDQVIDGCGMRLIAVVPEDPSLFGQLPEAMARTLDFARQKFQQKADGGAIALHCLAERLLGRRVPLRNLDRL